MNVPNLIDTLKQFDAKKEWYIGKASTEKPLHLINRCPEHVSSLPIHLYAWLLLNIIINLNPKFQQSNTRFMFSVKM